MDRLKKFGGRLVEPGQRVVDNIRLMRSFPFLKDYNYEKVASKTGLGAEYETYTNVVSPAASAMSLELACFIEFICEHIKPRSILDTGSGFSSYMFRSYRARTGTDCEIFSVDDNPQWLGKTISYIEQAELGTDNLMTWDEFTALPTRSFDLISHDIGGVAGRASTLPFLLQLVHSDSVLLIDDIHKPHFRRPIEKILSSHKLRPYDISKFTRDAFDRYAMLLTGFQSHED